MEDRFLYSEADDTIFIKIEGNATMKNSKTLSDLLAKIFKGEKRIWFLRCLLVTTWIVHFWD